MKLLLISQIIIITTLILFSYPTFGFYFRKHGPPRKPCKKCEMKSSRFPNIHPPNVTIHLQHLDESLSKCGPKNVDIRELTIELAQKYFRTGILTSFELTMCYLVRIDKMDKKYLKSVIEVNPDATEIAKKADKERVMGKPISLNPLHGIPILIKDNIGTGDNMMTTCGSIAMDYIKSRKDSGVVKMLRAAGAIILGKSNPVEWANFRLSNNNISWSGRGGQTLSPYNLTSTPSGSSSGSAVAVSANLAMVSLGSETDGSILSPSSRGSLVGLKPTLGAVSTKGVIPLSFSQDVVGPMARTVSDASIVMDAIYSSDHPHPYFKEDKLFTVGVVEKGKYWNMTDSMLSKITPKLEAAINILRDVSLIKIIDSVRVNQSEKLNGDNELIVFTHEFKYSLNRYLQHDVLHFESLLGRKITSLADIIKFNDDFPEEYEQDLLIATEATDGIKNSTYLTARDNNREGAKALIDQIMDTYGLDAIGAPCDGDTDNFYSVGAISGYPSITVPVGLDDDEMPFGFCFTGKENSEATLLKLGHIFEKSLSVNPQFGRRLPRFI